MIPGIPLPCISPQKEMSGVTSGVTRMYRCGGTVSVTTSCRKKNIPFDLLTVLPTRLDVEVNGFNGGVLNGVPSAYHWYTEQYGVKWPCGYELNISSQGDHES